MILPFAEKRHGLTVRFQFLAAHLAQALSHPSRDRYSRQFSRSRESLFFQCIDAELQEAGFGLAGSPARPTSRSFHAESVLQKNT
jgi:hypothetical protein